MFCTMLWCLPKMFKVHFEIHHLWLFDLTARFECKIKTHLTSHMFNSTKSCTPFSSLINRYLHNRFIVTTQSFVHRSEKSITILNRFSFAEQIVWTRWSLFKILSISLFASHVIFSSIILLLRWKHTYSKMS